MSEEMANQVGADKARATGDEDFHGNFSSFATGDENLDFPLREGSCGIEGLGLAPHPWPLSPLGRGNPPTVPPCTRGDQRGDLTPSAPRGGGWSAGGGGGRVGGRLNLFIPMRGGRGGWAPT